MYQTLDFCVSTPGSSGVAQTWSHQGRWPTRFLICLQLAGAALSFGSQVAAPPQVGPCDDEAKDRALHSTRAVVAIEYRGYSASRTKYGFDTFQTTSPPQKYLLMTTTDQGLEVTYTGNCGYLGPMTCYSGSVRFEVNASWTNATAVSAAYSHCDPTPIYCGSLGSYSFYSGPPNTGSGSDSSTFSIGNGRRPSYNITGAGSCSGSVHFTPDAITGYRQELYSTSCGGSGVTNYNGGLPLIDVQAPIVDSATVRHATNSASYTPGIRTWTLTEEYTTPMLEQNAWGDLDACSAPSWSGMRSYAACTGTCGSNTLAEAWAYRQMTANETNIALRRLEFRFRIQTQREANYLLHWIERTTYASGSAPVNVRRTAPVEGTGAEVITEVYSLLPPGVNGTNAVVAYWLEPLAPCAGSCQVADDNDNPRLPLDLGQAAFGKPAGQLWLEADTPPSPALATPQSLMFLGNTNRTTVIRDGNGAIQQVQAAQMLADIVTTNFGYAVRFYAMSNGVYLTNAAPFQEWTVENLDQSTNSCNHLRAVEDRNGWRVTNEWEYVAASNLWSFTSGSGLRKKIKRTEWDAAFTNRTETYEIRDANDRLLKKTVKKYGVFSGVERLIEKKQDPDGLALTTTYLYDANGQLAQFTRTDGYWEKYSFGNTVLGTSYKPLLNLPATPSASGATTTYNYGALGGSGDDLTISPNIARTITEGTPAGNYTRQNVFLPGQEKAIISAGTGGWNSTDNPLTIYTYFTNGAFTAKIKSIQYPDKTWQIFDYADGPEFRTNFIWAGQYNASSNQVVDGTKIIEVIDVAGQPRSRIVQDIVSGLTLAQETYTVDELSRPIRVDYLDGTSIGLHYNCCSLDAVTNRDGSVVTYEYDALKRRQAEHRFVNASHAISTYFNYDAAGKLRSVVRQGTNGTQVTLRQLGYDGLGRLTAETNAVGTVTTYGYLWDTNGQTIVTTTYAAGTADAATRVETYARDGSLLKVTGSATHPVRYSYSVSNPKAVRTILLDAAGADTSEWRDREFDGAGRFKYAYSSIYPSYAETQFDYNTNNQVTRRLTLNGNFLVGYNGKGEAETNALDLNNNSALELAGTDRITRTVSDVVTNYGTTVRRVRTWVWPTNNTDSSVLASTVETSADGLRTWETTWGLTTRTEWTLPVNGVRTRTRTQPDGSSVVDLFSYGRLASTTRYDSNSVQLGQTSYAFDAFGRQYAVIDARNGATVYGFDDADRVVSVTSPEPGTGQPAQTTWYEYDARDRATRLLLPDGGSVTNEYLPSGELRKSSGTRTYPVEYVYDTAGRLRTNTTWQQAGVNGAATTMWNYDSVTGLLTSKRYTDNTGPNYAYPATGGINRARVYQRTWARGTVATYTYNNAGELTKITYTGGSATDRNLAYDRLGRLTTAQLGPDGGSATSTNSYRYSVEGLLLTETQPSNLILTNTYDALQRRSSLAWHGQSVTLEQFGYDAASRLTDVAGGVSTATYEYLANSPLVGQITVRSNGTTRMTTSKQHDHLNRLLQIAAVLYTSAAVNSAYVHNDANQRVQTTLADGSYWRYEYDKLGQVTSGKKYWSDGTPVAGQQFEYTFDDIGNRTATKAGGDERGAALRAAYYIPNLLNQVTNRTVPGAVDVMGAAYARATVTVQGQPAYRKGEYYRAELTLNNASAPVWQAVTNTATEGGNTSNVWGNVWLDRTPQVSRYDADGNLTNDGRWTYAWDEENRLTNLTSVAGVPAGACRKLDFTYDYFGRRIRKRVSTLVGTNYVAQSTNRYVYDGWNLIAILDHPSALLYSFTWGLDLSGSMQGAGGVGGLLAMTVHSGALAGTYNYAYDGNGNVVALVNAADGTLAATYEYGPFGEVLRASGPLARVNPFRFSTKYQDDETDLLYYAHRYYDASTGRWLSRDPLEEEGAANLYGFVEADAVNGADALGLWNLWNPLTYGDANGAGWSLLDSLNPLHESAGYSADYFRQSLASATGLGIFGDYDPCDKLLERTRVLGRASTLALEIFGPMRLAAWAAAGGGMLRAGTAFALDAYGLSQSAAAIGTGAGKLSAGDAWGALDVALGALGIKPGITGLLRSGSTLAAAERGYVSGYRQIMARARAARAGDVGAMGEIEAARVLRSEGINVHFQKAVGPRGPGTADFLVGGQRGTGIGGLPTDVYTPTTRDPDNVIKGIFQKDNQAPNIILNLRHSPVRPDDLGDVLDRVNNFHPDFPGRISTVRVIE